MYIAICIIWFILWILWIKLISIPLGKIWNKFRPTFLEKKEDLDYNYRPFQRSDASRWSKFEIYFIAYTILPIKLLGILILTTLYFLVVLITTHNYKFGDHLSSTKRFIIKYSGRILSRSILFLAGFYWISKKKVQINSFEKNYPSTEYKDKKEPFPIIISNHVSWVDIFYYISSDLAPSFLSKAAVRNIPLVGRIAVGLQSVFLERESEKERENSLSQIGNRVDQILNGGNKPPLLIFAEGTTTNGEYLISFKKGGFYKLSPVKIVGLKYDTSRFSPALDCFDAPFVFLMTLCQFKNTLTVYEFDVYYPYHLKLQDEEDWDKYANQIKNILANCLNINISDSGFTQKKEYFKMIGKEY